MELVTLLTFIWNILYQTFRKDLHKNQNNVTYTLDYFATQTIPLKQTKNSQSAFK